MPQPVREPASPTLWKASHDPALTLSPPVAKRELALDAATSEFEGVGVRLCEVQVLGVIGGRSKVLASRVLRASDAGAPAAVPVYGDLEKPMATVVFWTSRHGRASQGPTLLEGEAVSLLTPSEDWLREKSR